MGLPNVKVVVFNVFRLKANLVLRLAVLALQTPDGLQSLEKFNIFWPSVVDKELHWKPEYVGASLGSVTNQLCNFGQVNFFL